jgi:hypothetical protein
MSQLADSAGNGALRNDENGAETRVFRAMITIVALTAVGALILAPWRVTTGLILGGGLSLLNYYWLRRSMTVLFHAPESPPRINVVKFIFRYFLIAAIVGITYKLGIISLPATIVGLCSFVGAFFLEASRQSYLAITGREESF